MNREAFQIYGLKKNIFQSTWNTNLVETSTIELASTATGTNWTGTSYALGYTHTPGSTVVLTSAISATIGLNYRLTATITSRTAGSITINYGGTSNAGIFSSTTLDLLASTTGQLTIVPTSDFDGKIVISLRNTSAPSNQLKLPLVSTGTYNFWIDWGDGSVDNITSWNQAERIHTYASPGIYKTRISGIITGWESITSANQIGDRKKLTSITSWGKLKLTTARGFQGCSNLTLSTVDDILDLSTTTTLANTFSGCSSITTIGRINEWNTSNITAMSACFQDCTNFNSPLSNWNTANVTTMGVMFYQCTNFNQNLGNWNVSNCLDFSGMFQSTTNFNNGGSTSINNWVLKTSGNINMNAMFSSSRFNQPLNSWNTTRVTNMGGMFSGNTFFNQNIGAWDASNWNTGPAYMFSNASAFNNGGSADINNWIINSSISVSLNFSQMFSGAGNFNQPINNWNMSRATSVNLMFYYSVKFNNGLAPGVPGVLNWNTSSVLTSVDWFSCLNPAFNCDISSWNVSSVSDFNQMFYGATTFNNGGSPNINNWVLKSTGTINMGSMFRGATAFNQPLNLWNMSRVTSTGYMFLGANAFNQNVDGWNLSTATNVAGMFECASFNNGHASGVGNIITMTLNTTTPFVAWQMFRCAAFNCDINGLDFTQCTNMNYMLAGATKYNNGLTPGIPGVLTINTSNVTNMYGMFDGAILFNQDVGLFDVSKVISFNGMFYNTYAYNNGADANPINNWTLNTTVGANIDMTRMFGGNSGAKVFNRALNNWNTSEVTNMSNMFLNSGGTHSFNQPIDNWNVSKVTRMDGMFNGNKAFNQSLINWERVGSTLANVTTMESMFSGSIFNNGLASGISGILTWNTSNVTNMGNMFIYNSIFNQCIGGWNVSKVTNFGNMLLASTSFNNGDDSLPINNWVLNNTVGANISLAGLFGSNLGNMVFNRNIGSWNTSKVTNMSSMFDKNPAFQQYIGAWNVSNVTNFTTFMSTKTPSTFPSTYLDNIYNGWIVNTVKPNLIISFGTAKYTQAAKAGRNTLTSSVISGGYNWTITDGLLTVSGTSNNGGLIRVTTTAVHGFVTGDVVNIYGVNGTTNANGTWTVTVITTTIIQLNSSVYDAAWTSGGNVILG